MQPLGIIEQCHSDLLQNPSKINEITLLLLNKLAQSEQTHKKTINASTINILLNNINIEQILDEGPKFIKLFLIFNSIRIMIEYNFAVQLKTNKIYKLFCQSYTQMMRQIHESHINSLILACNGYLISQVMLKLLLKTGQFVPEYFQFAIRMLEFIIYSYNPLQNKIQIELTELISHIYQFNQQKNNFNIAKEIGNRILQQIKKYLLVCQGYLFINDLKIMQNIKQHKWIKQFLQQNKEKENIIYLKQPQQVKQLTPRIIDQQQQMQIKKLRKKKIKLEKSIALELRKKAQSTMQEREILMGVRTDKFIKKQKKEQFVMEKQTQEAKKQNKIMKKVKAIKKSSGNQGKIKDKMKNNKKNKNRRNR